MDALRQQLEWYCGSPGMECWWPGLSRIRWEETEVNGLSMCPGGKIGQVWRLSEVCRNGFVAGKTTLV